MRSSENYTIIFSIKIYNLILYKLGYYFQSHFEEKIKKKNFPTVISLAQHTHRHTQTHIQPYFSCNRKLYYRFIRT